jgi:hypothetical protein
VSEAGPTQRRIKAAGAKSVMTAEQTPQTPQVLGEASGTEADHPNCCANDDGRDVGSGNSVKDSRQLIDWRLPRVSVSCKQTAP